jgi:glucose/arabinose dehydrogenase
VVFVPLRGGRPLGSDEGSGWEVFADGFTGKEAIKSPSESAYRPTGLAEGPDGALYVTEDSGGRIWRITYVGK